jgi:hypothetical protein
MFTFFNFYGFIVAVETTHCFKKDKAKALSLYREMFE